MAKGPIAFMMKARRDNDEKLDAVMLVRPCHNLRRTGQGSFVP